MHFTFLAFSLKWYLVLKALDDEYRKAYNPKAVESGWYSWWEKEGFHEPEFADNNVKKAGYFVISEPPPNVTGES